MKKIKSALLGFVFLFLTLSQQGCIGSFQLTGNLYDWNKNQVGEKWGQELVFALLVIFPVYEVTLLADGIVLNSIEFWTGSNPLALTDGEKETQIVQNGEDTYQLTAEKNTLQVEKLAGKNSGEQGEFVWDPQTQNWTYCGGGKTYSLKK